MAIWKWLEPPKAAMGHPIRGAKPPWAASWSVAQLAPGNGLAGRLSAQSRAGGNTIWTPLQVNNTNIYIWGTSPFTRYSDEYWVKPCQVNFPRPYQLNSFHQQVELNSPVPKIKRRKWLYSIFNLLAVFTLLYLSAALQRGYGKGLYLWMTIFTGPLYTAIATRLSIFN